MMARKKGIIRGPSLGLKMTEWDEMHKEQNNFAHDNADNAPNAERAGFFSLLAAIARGTKSVRGPSSPDDIVFAIDLTALKAFTTTWPSLLIARIFLIEAKALTIDSVREGRILTETSGSLFARRSNAPAWTCCRISEQILPLRWYIPHTFTSPELSIVWTAWLKSTTDIALRSLFIVSLAASDMSSIFVSFEIPSGRMANVMSWEIMELRETPSSVAAEAFTFGLKAYPTKIIKAWARLFKIVDAETEWSPSLKPHQEYNRQIHYDENIRDSLEEDRLYRLRVGDMGHYTSAFLQNFTGSLYRTKFLVVSLRQNGITNMELQCIITVLEHWDRQWKGVLNLFRRLFDDTIGHLFKEKHANRGQEISWTENINKMGVKSAIRFSICSEDSMHTFCDTNLFLLWRGMWFAASENTRRNSFEARYRSRGWEWASFSEDTITGTMPSIVYSQSVTGIQVKHLYDAYLLYDFEAVTVIAVENIRSHEGENRHNIEKNGFRSKTGKVGDEQEGLVESLWVSRYCRRPWAFFDSKWVLYRFTSNNFDQNVKPYYAWWYIRNLLKTMSIKRRKRVPHIHTVILEAALSTADISSCSM